MHDYFDRCIEAAGRQGLEKILIDPGLGFYYRNLQDSSVRVRFQMRVFLESFRLRSLGVPVCQALPHAFEYFGEEVRSAEGVFCGLGRAGEDASIPTHKSPESGRCWRRCQFTEAEPTEELTEGREKGEPGQEQDRSKRVTGRGRGRLFIDLMPSPVIV